MGIAQNREAALSKLLTSMFDGDGAGLLRWVRLQLGKRIHDELATAPLSQLAFDTTLAIQRHGLAGQAFASLCEERPGHAERIQEVADLWGIMVEKRVVGEPTTSGSTPTMARPWHVPDLPPHDHARQAPIDAVVHTLPHGHNPELAPLPPVSRMPMPRNPLFVGRADELRLLAEALQVGSTAAIGQVASVTGLGGMGKTQLAAEFVHRYGQFFTGGVFWLGFSEPASVLGQFLQYGGPAHLGLWSSEAAPNIDTQVAMVRAAFAAPVPRLLVFDNCEDEELLVEWLPRSGGCRVLLTCRRREFSNHLRVCTLALDVLPRSESLQLLRSFDRGPSFNPADDATLDAICHELGDLPLALHLAGSFLSRYRNAVTPAAYLAQLREQALLGHPSLQGRGAASSPTGHELHVGLTFALSWNRLDPADAVDAMARDLLLRAACLASGEPIPHMLLVLATLAVPRDDYDAALVREDALHRLLDLGLLETPERGAYRIHRLVSAFVRQTDGDHAAARAAVEQALLREAERANDSGFPARFLPWQPHLSEVTQAVRAREDEQAARLCDALSFHLRTIADYRGARPYSERALAIREQQLGPEHPSTATSLNNLAALLHAQGALTEARPLYERALAICEQQLGPEHPATAASLTNLAALLQDQGDLTKARPLFKRALAIREQQLGPEHPLTATSLNHLAGLLHAQSALAKARPLFERALAICEQQLGPEHPSTAQSLTSLGALLRDQGAHAKARPLFERALAICEQHLGSEHPLTAASLNHLARLLRDQGALRKARPLFERALAICEQQLGPEHPHTAACLNNLAALLQDQGALAKARPLFERALAICEQQLGPEHPHTAAYLNNLAALLRDQGALAEARPLFERALAICEAGLASDHALTRRVRDNLQRMQLQNNRWKWLLPRWKWLFLRSRPAMDSGERHR